MNSIKQIALTSRLWSTQVLMALAVMTALVAETGLALAGPGAHGPNGEHLDPPAVRTSAGPPRFAASSEAFELVGELDRGMLTLYLDRYETNQPVTDAKLELESGAVRAIAQYLADREVYQVAATEFIESISKPGEHSLVITVLAGRESDLLDASLQISAAGARSIPAAGRSIAGHDHAWEAALGAGVALLLVAAGLYGWRRQQRKRVRISVGVSP